MDNLTRQQKESLRQVQEMLECDRKTAYSFLNKAKWVVATAVEMFYDNPNSAALQVDQNKIASVFAQYADATDKDTIGPEGVERLCADLGVDPSDIVTLVIAYKMHAARMAYFTRKEFLEGMTSMGCTSIEDLKAKLPELRKELERTQDFKHIYQYAFDFGRDPSQKNLALDVAIPLWQLLLPGRFHYLQEWCAFLQAESSHSMPRDTWNLLLEFAVSVGNNIDQYDPAEAWPVLIDQFVEYLREKNVQ